MKEVKGKKEIIRQLKEKILEVEGFCSEANGQQFNIAGLGPIVASFPGNNFPVGAIHEFVSPTEACATAANGFIAGLLNSFVKKSGFCLWISSGRKLFPSALKLFGVEPDRVIFVDVKRGKDVLWAMEQGLKCSALTAVVAELREVSFAESRRLQLAVEGSRVTGFLHRHHLHVSNTLACVSRWKIRPVASQLSDGLPGVGFPRWEVELEKIRNGKPGIWQFEWQGDAFRYVPVIEVDAIDSELFRKRRYYA